MSDGDRRLMMLLTTDRRRGAEVRGERLAAGLRGRGWVVDLVSLTRDRDGPTVSAIPVSDRSPEELGRLTLGVVRGLRRWIRATGPDVLIANGAATLRYSLAATADRRSTRLAYVSIGEPGYWLRGARHRRIQSRLIQRVDLVIAVSEATRRQMITELGVAPDKVVVLESGVPEAFISEGRTSHGGPFRLLWVGSLSREKDPEAAVRVVQRALASSDVVLRIVGDGPLRDDLASLIVEESMSRAVELVGSARDVLAHLSWADALLLSSRTEGLPGSVLEAAASGIPSVAFDVGGTKEVVLDDVTGKLVRSGDEDAMVEAIIELARDEGKRRKMGTAAQRMVRERFLMEHAVDRYHRVLLERFLPGEGLPSDRPDQ